MKVSVRIDDRTFEVEIANLHTRPIVALVEGEQFEVWPETMFAALPAPAQPGSAAQAVGSPTSPIKLPPPPGAAHDGGHARANVIQAPIPGVIVSIAVEAGETVATGQEVCVLEAMKMKNSIRAPRAGTIGRVTVAVGAHVQHHELLMDYAD